MNHYPHSNSTAASRAIVWAVVALGAAYAVCLVAGWPQEATRRIVAGHGSTGEHPGHQPDESRGQAEDKRTDPQPPPLATVLPFGGLLMAIAVLPLIPATRHWWEHNRNRLLVAVCLALVTLAYYIFLHRYPIERHFLGHAPVAPAGNGVSWSLAGTVLQNAILGEYIPFIVLLFSLYTISGGIRVEGDLRAHPETNTAFIGIAGLLASIVGTTGAAMLLIRPLLQTNSERRHVVHTVIFFIFVACNCGGCLTPLGDPPLFLGYLQGVDFLWTLRLWPAWLFVNGLLLAIYYVWDRFLAYPREQRADIARDEAVREKLRVTGLGVNGPLLVLLVLSVALLDPTKPLLGGAWHPWLYLRELVQLGLVAMSLAFGSPEVRTLNRFTYAAILEVAALFLGIFICMQPALQILDAQGARLGLDTAQKFFWATGALSSVLDNAPTYLVFFEAARSLPSAGMRPVAGVAEPLLAAISLGAVFMGAMTYIGNGPNFMVKAVAEASGVKMPSFFGYLAYSCGILLPILALATLLFL
jgi:Na+/H+ antiporter NhaD/arsenite permease-like protein